MDTILSIIAATVANEIEYTSFLLDAINLIPPASPEVEILQYLESESESLHKQEAEEAKRLCTQLSLLWKLETTVLSNDDESLTKNSSNLNDQKIRKSLFNATVSLATSIHDSSPSIKQMLLKFKNDKGIAKKDFQYDCIIKLKEYLNELKSIACRDISTSVRQDEQITTSLFKIIEKCNVLDEEKTKMSTSVDEAEQMIKEESLKVKMHHKAISQALTQGTMEVQREEKIIEDETATFLQNEENKYNLVFESLKSELAKVQSDFTCLQESNISEINEKLRCKNEIKKQLSELITKNKEDEKNLLKEIKEVTRAIQEEKDEKQKLEQLIAVEELNDITIAKEKALIQEVIDLETEADSILNHGSTQIQKLYRGMRDRAIVKSLKKKRKKGKKGKRGNNAKKK